MSQSSSYRKKKDEAVLIMTIYIQVVQVYGVLARGCSSPFSRDIELFFIHLYVVEITVTTESK